MLYLEAAVRKTRTSSESENDRSQLMSIRSCRSNVVRKDLSLGRLSFERLSFELSCSTGGREKKNIKFQ